MGREVLPLDRHHPVPLEVPERSVVGDDLEAIVDPFQASAGFVTTVGALTDIGGDDRLTVGGTHRRHLVEQGGVAQVGVGRQHGGDHLHLGVGVPVHQPHRCLWHGVHAPVEEPLGHPAHR